MKTPIVFLTAVFTLLAGGRAVGADAVDPHLTPVGDGWKAILNGHDLGGLIAQAAYWRMEPDGVLHGATPGGEEHHYAYTQAEYADFELHADVRLVGYNSGVCIRIAPTSFDNVPGYQVDMGIGYWGCLWDERGNGMVAKFSEDEAAKVVRANDWNHFHVRAEGHHIQIWLNGVPTVDVVDENGRLSGPIGFQLCHGDKGTDASFKNVVIRPLESP